MKAGATAIKILGSRIREARKAKGWTQEEFAHRSNLDRSYVGGIERGQRNITFLILCQISEALGTDIPSLTFGLPTIRR